MNVRTLTVIVLVSTTILLISYDVYAVLTGGVEATLSRVVLESSAANPIIGFAAGVLCGHLFWPQDKRTLDRKPTVPVAQTFGRSGAVVLNLTGRESELVSNLNAGFIRQGWGLVARMRRTGVLEITPTRS